MMIRSKKRAMENAKRNERALARLSVSELETGRPDSYWQEWHRTNRERVLRRYGVS